MKFVKQNLVVLICAAVALLLVVAAFVWPVPGWIATIKTENMQARLGMRSVIKNLTTTSLSLPGQPERKGIPSKEYIQAKQDSIKAIQDAKDKVVDASKAENLKGRVVMKGAVLVPVLPVPGAGPKGQGIEEEGFLPKVNADPAKYKADYRSQFPLWLGLLSQGTIKAVDPDETMPPDPAALKAAWDEQQLKLRPTGGATGGYNPNASADSAEALSFEKQGVMNKAASLRMYVERSAFQQRPWSLTDSSPDEVQIFESLVDSWLQSDVVKAIVATNLQSNSRGDDSKHIGISAVKRLTRIVVGVNARNHLVGQPGSLGVILSAAGNGAVQSTDPGALFLLPSNVVGGSGGGAQPVLVNGGGAVATSEDQLPANEIRYEVGMSGRAAGHTYDIVNMAIQVDIDPAKLNAFINELYRQNPGYTVSGVQIKAVDPLDRASNGFLYGEGQVIEAEIQVECLFFRNWTRPIMPDGESAILGIPPYKAPPAAAPGAAAPAGSD